MKHNVPTHMIPVYNDFVRASQKLLFTSLAVHYGHTRDGKEGLEFELETDTGLSDQEAERIFGTFIKRHPSCRITYNKRPEPTALENVLYECSATVLEVHEGFKLKPIK